uniref:Sodium/potassium/calcium exchanger 1 n=1 Tax=Castor canadensis TaxID=51338 RepID=A0A8C0W0F6_CASCN
MGKLIRMGVQERRLLRPKRLHWSRLLFLLGMLIIGSTYQHLRRPRGLPSLWSEVSSQKPVKLASRDLPNGEMTVESSDPPKAVSEVEGEMLAPQTTVATDEATDSITMENTPKTPRRITKFTPTTPKNNYHPTTAGTERVKENTPTTPSRVLNHYTPTSSRQTVSNYTPTPRGKRKSYGPTQARGMGQKEISNAITPRTTVKDSETMATSKTLETSSSKRIVEETTPATVKRTVKNIPTFLTSPRSVVENNTLTSSRRVENNSADFWRAMEKNNLTTSQVVLEHTSVISEGHVTISTMVGSIPAKIKTSAAWSLRNPSPRTNAPTIRTSSSTIWELSEKPSTAHSSSVTPKARANTATQVHHCVIVKPSPELPTTPSSLLPQAPSPSPSALLPNWPALHPKAEYPPDLFSVEERQQGWVALHIFGMMYVFVALAIVCDEYFVPALGVITDKLQISEDVAGATFMAAGGSAPELFTSLIGVFISHSNVGIGTIVGSAVFNILFVIGTCALFSREILNLTWWPLFRDVSFYILDLSMLIFFFLDSLIAWWESLLLLLAYALYVFTMKWNKQIELWVKEQLSKRPVTKVMALEDHSKPGEGAIAMTEQQDNKKLKLSSMLTRGSSSASLHNSIVRSTIYHLMLHSLDPLGEARPSKDKQESLNQEAKAQPQAKAESKPEEEEPAKLPAVTVTPAPAPDVQGDQEEDPGSQVGAQLLQLEGFRRPREGHSEKKCFLPEADSKGEVTGQEAETPGKGETEEKCRAETQPEGEIEAEGGDEHEGETEAEGNGDEHEGEIEAEGKGDEHEGETNAEGQREDEHEGETEAEGKEDKHEGETKTEGQREDEHEGETEAEGQREDEHEGETEEEEEEEDEEEEEEEEEEEDEEEEGSEEPLSLDWPETRQKQAIYLFLLPIVFPLWLTVPDVRRQESRKFFVITFLGSIIWIAMFSYLMVWWAHQVGETIGISEAIMGLTILAAGTSIPDLITSVIVARKGLGDMAVSSSVGSNIFDITVGLPVPWLLFSLINGLQPVPVSSNGLFCAIVLLFLMLLFVIFSIALCKWRMNKILGFTMFLLYFVFLIISVMLEDRIISCPVSV